MREDPCINQGPGRKEMSDSPGSDRMKQWCVQGSGVIQGPAMLGEAPLLTGTLSSKGWRKGCKQGPGEALPGAPDRAEAARDSTVSRFSFLAAFFSSFSSSAHLPFSTLPLELLSTPRLHHHPYTAALRETECASVPTRPLHGHPTSARVQTKALAALSPPPFSPPKAQATDHLSS